MSKKKFDRVFKKQKIENTTITQPLVKIKELTKFKGTVKQFIQEITFKNPGYIVTGKSITHLWWEDIDMWFMNYGTQRKRNVSTYGWYIAKDLVSIINSYITEGGEMYFLDK